MDATYTQVSGKKIHAMYIFHSAVSNTAFMQAYTQTRLLMKIYMQFHITMQKMSLSSNKETEIPCTCITTNIVPACSYKFTWGISTFIHAWP